MRWKPITKEIIYDEKKLYNYGINRLSSRDYGRNELGSKMSRFQKDGDMVAKVLDKLEEQGYLSDERRTKNIINQFSGRESINKTKNRMLQKGLSKDTISEVLDNMEKPVEEASPEIITAKELLSKKFKSLDDEKIKEKMVRFLASKGFKYDDIKKAMDSFFNPE